MKSASFNARIRIITRNILANTLVPILFVLAGIGLPLTMDIIPVCADERSVSAGSSSTDVINVNLVSRNREQSPQDSRVVTTSRNTQDASPGETQLGFSPIPETRTIILIGAGLLAAGLYGRKKLKK